MTFDDGQGIDLPISETMRLASEHYEAGRFFQAEAQCQKLLLAAPHDAGTIHLREQICRQLDNQVRNAVKGFQLTPNPTTIVTLRETRRELVYFLLVQSSSSLAALWTTSLRDAHSQLMKSGLRNYLRNASEDAMAAELRGDLMARQKGSADPARLLAVMLLVYCHELPPPENLPTVPEWLREIYVDFLLEMPDMFNKVGEADVYCDYLHRLVEIFHRLGFTDHGITLDPIARKLISLFALKANYVQAYFNTRNLRDIYAQRGDITSAAMIIAGGQTLTVQPPRVGHDGKIRLGIFKTSYSPGAETYFTLSHFEHLDRTRFFVILYAENSTGHSLEQHCIAHADRFVILPLKNLAATVNQIRADDLDILLISTNMSAVPNTATLLGTFRLARIQVASVSSPVTTGCRHMDVMLSAEWNELEKDAGDHYTEHLYLMPGSINYYAYQYDKDPVTIKKITRADLGITDGQIVFFSGANYYKILPELSLAWVEILAAVPDSTLILMPFNPNWNKQYQSSPFVERIQRQMTDKGVSINRLRVINPVPTRADVHCVLALADIYLDAYPFSGACSMIDPIIVGIPPIARRGPVGRSNHAASLLYMLGLEELVTESEHQFIAAAIAMAGDPTRRQRIRDRLLGFRNGLVPPYFDIQLFSTRVGSALHKMHEQYTGHYRDLGALDGVTLRAQLQKVADAVVGANFELNTLTDLGIIRALIEPFFRHHQSGETPHMVDVGACYGQMAAPLLVAGWTADLFEPDPGARQVLEKNLANFGKHCRVFASAVSNVVSDSISFHQSRSHGLSGLGDSPFGPTDNIIEVPCVRLADFYLHQGVKKVDFLKIDAEGYDFDALESNDFSVMRPRLILIEYGTHFPRQTLTTVNSVLTRMVAAGYGSIVFNYTDDGNFQKGQWVYRMTDMFVDNPIPAERVSAFGNIVFYRAEDREFLLTVYALLENCFPRSALGQWR